MKDIAPVCNNESQLVDDIHAEQRSTYQTRKVVTWFAIQFVRTPKAVDVPVAL
jgi:hypothetical protein